MIYYCDFASVEVVIKNYLLTYLLTLSRCYATTFLQLFRDAVTCYPPLCLLSLATVVSLSWDHVSRFDLILALPALTTKTVIVRALKSVKRTAAGAACELPIMSLRRGGERPSRVDQSAGAGLLDGPISTGPPRPSVRPSVRRHAIAATRRGGGTRDGPVNASLG